jgi:hypothetical protein
MTTKDIVRETLDRLPDDVTMDEVIDRLDLMRKITIGLRQDDSDDVHEHEDVKQEFRDAADESKK